MYISDPPVPFWSCLYQKNTTWYKFFGCTRLFVLNMKTHVKSTRRKRLRTPSRTNLRSYIAHHPRLPTLPSRKTNLTMATSTTGMHLSRRTYVPVFLQTVTYIYIHTSHTSPLLVLPTTEKHYKLFGITRLFDLDMKIHFRTTRRKRPRIPSRTNLRRRVFYHSRFVQPGRRYV